LPRNSRDAIFYLNFHNIKLLTRDSSEVCCVNMIIPFLENALCPDLDCVSNKKAQLSLTNPRDACEMFARFT